MKVEIWSDIVCPFCYIGKRRFEQALAGFAAKDQVEVVWRSYQLDPTAEAAPGKTQAQVLAEKKGWSLAQTKAAMDHVTQMAKDAGLNYNMDKAVVANTMDAHRLTHLAHRWGLQDAAEERLFRAYFVEGENIGDKITLARIGAEIGLPSDAVEALLSGDEFREAVLHDQAEAAGVGVQGVPFFVFNNKYAVSGAQSSEVFRQVLEKVWEEEKPVEIIEGAGFCGPDGLCT